MFATDLDTLAAILARRAPDLAATLLAVARPCAALIAGDITDQVLPPGTSKIGGTPDVPEGWSWPYWLPDVSGRRRETAPLAFLAQVNLAEVAALDVPGLPGEGLLSVFYDVEHNHGVSRTHRNGLKVAVFPLPGLAPASPPPGVHVFPCAPLTLRTGVSIPGRDSLALTPDAPAVARDPAFQEQWGDLGEHSHGDAHQLGGWPSPRANPAEFLWEAGFNGLMDDYSVTHERNALTRAPAWRLLLQIDSDQERGWCWGDAGVIQIGYIPGGEFPWVPIYGITQD